MIWAPSAAYKSGAVGVSETRPASPLRRGSMASPIRVIDIRKQKEPIHEELIRACQPDATMARLLAALRGRLDVAPEVEPTLGGALHYLLKHAGGMVRPRIVYRLAGAYGINDEAATDLA